MPKRLDTPRTIEVIRQQRERFIRKFGREPEPNDPIFFDQSRNTPVPVSRPQLGVKYIEAMQARGIPDDYIYASAATGVEMTPLYWERITRWLEAHRAFHEDPARHRALLKYWVMERFGDRAKSEH